MLEPPPPAGGLNGGSKVESAAVSNPPKVARQGKPTQLSAVPKRRQRNLTTEAVTNEAVTGEGLTLEAMRAGGPSSFVESTRLLTKEQLVYALRFTGAKLKDVRERAQGTKSSSQ